MSEKKYYVCEVCGNIIEKVRDSGNMVSCCNRLMRELIPGVSDGKVEFHVPVCELKDNVLTVHIGKEPHPMDEKHYIQWISVITTKGEMRRCLKPGDEPVAHFHICDSEKVCAIYAYCNLHELWKLKMEKCD